MTDPTDLPTPEQVATYLEAAGWSVQHDHPFSEVAVLWLHPDAGNVLLYRDRVDLMESLDRVGRIEGRPTPAEQVRRDMCGERRRYRSCDGPRTRNLKTRKL